MVALSRALTPVPLAMAAFTSGRSPCQGKSAIRSVVTSESPAGEEQPAPLSNAEAASVRGGLRFRRGTRLGSASAVIPMIGVVNLDEEPPVAEPAKKGRAPAKKKAAKAAPASPDEAEAPPPKKKAAPRARAKKKTEE